MIRNFLILLFYVFVITLISRWLTGQFVDLSAFKHFQTVESIYTFVITGYLITIIFPGNSFKVAIKYGVFELLAITLLNSWMVFEFQNNTFWGLVLSVLFYLLVGFPSLIAGLYLRVLVLKITGNYTSV